MNSIQQTSLDRREYKNDPYIDFPYPPGNSNPHPSYFNPKNLNNLFNTSVPIIFERFTNMPDSLLNALRDFNLNRMEIRLLMAVHKNTLGFLYTSQTDKYKSDRVTRSKKKSINTISFQYGSEYKPKNMKQRQRFIKTTYRDLAIATCSSKSSMQRAAQSLSEKGLIDYDTCKNNGTIIGINYHTIESVCGGTQMAFPVMTSRKVKKKNPQDTFVPVDGFKNMNEEMGIAKVDEKCKYYTKLSSSIEKLSKLFWDNGVIETDTTEDHPYTRMLKKVFTNNHFLLSPS